MTLIGIIFLILIGIILVLAEIFVFPGVGIVGIIGAIFMLLGIYFAYRINVTIGNWVLFGSVLFSVALGILSFRAKTWERLALKNEVTGKMNTFDAGKIKVGDQGITVSRLNPIGKAKINNEYYEVQAKSDMIDENEKIEVQKLDANKIIVKKIN